jgi:hypothetical protein
MFAGIEIASDVLRPQFWDTVLLSALAVASGWLVGALGPIVLFSLTGSAARTIRGSLYASDLPENRDAVEKIAEALAATDERAETARRRESRASAAPGRAERRERVRRLGRPRRVLLQLDEAQEEPILCWVTNRSTGGLGVVVERLVPIGSTVAVRPTDCPAKLPWATLEVRSCRRKGPRWYLGCQYLKEPPCALLLLFE